MKERESIKEALRESAERYRRLVERSTQMIAVLSEGKIVFVNAAGARFAGAEDPGELIGKPYLDFVHPDYREILESRVSRTREGEVAEPIEGKLLRLDGRTVDVEAIAVPTTHEDKPATLGVIRDVTERRRAEAEIRRLSRYNRTLFEANLAALMTLNPQGTITDVNKSTEEITGFSREELIGTDVFSYFEDPRKAREWFRQVLSEEAVRGHELDIRNSAGSTTPVAYNATVYRDEDGEIAGVLASARDITERKRTEEALLESERRFRQLFERSTDVLFVHDEQGRFVDCNAEACRALGYTRGELLALSVADVATHLLSEKDRRKRKGDTLWERAVRDEPGKIVGFEENELRRKGGTTFPVEVGVGAIEYGGRRLIFASARDVTERKRAEEALKESEERYRALMEQSVEAIYLYDAQTKRVLESNAAFRKLVGYSEEELLGMRIYDFIDHDKKNIDANIRRSLEEKQRHIGERRYRCKDGSVIIVDTSASVISYNGKMALCAVSRDITERKRAEEVLKESEERFRSLVQNASDVITILEADGTIRYDSPAIERVLGYRPEERVGKSAFDYIHPEDVERVRRTFVEAVGASGVQPPVEFRVRHKDGSWRHVEVTRSNLLDDPLVRGVVANSRDITERKEAEEALAEERNLLRTLIDNMPDFIFVKDRESRFVINNVEHARALGAPEEELVGKTDFDIFPGELAERYYADEQEVIKSGRPLIDREEPVTDSDGNERWLLTTKVPLRGETGEITGLVGISRDITERKALEEQLRHQVFHDPLTGLPNRALFLDRLGHALARSRRLGKPAAVLFVDLDNFKLVNDSLGHEKGDQLLVEVAERLASCIRPGDTVARIFGDEFGALLEPPTSVDDARRVAERMQEHLQVSLSLDGREVFVSSSVGITIGEPDRDADQYRPEDVLRQADLAMYAAKRRGRNRCEVFSPSMDVRTSERMELENDLRRAIERNEFEIHYQPIVDLRTSRIKGLEALARWRHPERGLLGAEEFIQLAEETGLIHPIGQRLFEEACREARRWNERLPDDPLLICVNFSASQFVRHADLIPRTLSETELDPRVLAVEITERVVMDDAEFALGKLRRLKNLGVSFGIDDYGTGYSCLRYLKLMPVSFLKIDRSFVAGLGEDPGDTAIVAGTIDLGHALGLKVIAEGVETADQLEQLKELKCDLAQGSYLSRPLASGEVSSFLADRRR